MTSRYLVFALVATQIFGRQPVRVRQGMVVAQEPIAADVGVEVLKHGGNAVDAAVAVGFALCATYPFAGNIGGGGFMLIRMADGRTTFVDFREKAPAAASHDMYLDANGNATRESIEGWRSVGVPGTVKGFDLAIRKYGTRPWADLVAPAVALARDGYVVSAALMDSLKGSRSVSANPESKRILQRNGNYYQAGETLVQPELAVTLERIQKQGPKDFYEGETAHALAE